MDIVGALGLEGAYPATTVIEVEKAPDPYLLFARTMKVYETPPVRPVAL
jgi:hypothetical protein